jgi:hypothetical protein
MIYRRPNFLAVYDLASPSPPPLPYPDSKLDLRHTGRSIKRDTASMLPVTAQASREKRRKTASRMHKSIKRKPLTSDGQKRRLALSRQKLVVSVGRHQCGKK